MTDLTPFAVAYATHGIDVFPLRARAKEPIAHTTGLHGASCDPAVVAQWWAGRLALPPKPPEAGKPPRPKAYASPQSNIGIPTGPRAGFWVFDIDGEDGAASLAALEAEHGALPATPEQLTGKGRHICFAWSEGLTLRNSASKVGKGIDVRGDGGYIVAAPSIHPSGRVYAWAPGLSPDDLDFAQAPPWLLDLLKPPAPRPAPAAPVGPRKRDGRATPYGEAALDRACREIASAPVGKKNDSLWLNAISIGRLVGGDQIERGYGLDALREAGRQMCAWTPREEDTLVRGFELGMSEPRTPEPLNRQGRPATPDRARVTPAEISADVQSARGLWASARGAWVAPAADWLRARGLDPGGLPDGLAMMRAHPAAPWGRGKTGPALLAPLLCRPLLNGIGEDVAAVAVLPLHADSQRFSHLIGEHAGRVAFLSPCAADDGADLVVAIDFQDAWRLGSDAYGRGRRMGVVVAPTLRTFAGGMVGDRFGRIDPAMPTADRADPPWRLSGQGDVYLAIRRDLRPPLLKTRSHAGGTREVELTGEVAARFFGGLAEQAWSTGSEDFIAANRVRLLAPPGAHGFNV